MAARVKSQAGGTDDGAALSIPSAFRNHLMLGATEAIMWIACRRHFSHEMVREHLERRGLNQRRRLHSGHVNCALQRRADKAQLELFRLIIGGVPATGTLDDEGHRDHKKRVPLPVEFLKDGAYIELLSGHLRADPLLEKHSGFQRPTYLNVSFDRDAFFKALAAAEPRSQATDRGNEQETSPASTRGRKKGSGSFAQLDAPLVKEMKELIDSGKVVSPHAAATQIADRAKGAGAPESKVRRLINRFNEKFGSI